MRRTGPVPCLSSDPAASCLASADRPWRPTPSSLPNRYPQSPYYRFYYGRPRIITDNSVRLPSPGGGGGRAREVSGSYIV